MYINIAKQVVILIEYGKFLCEVILHRIFIFKVHFYKLNVKFGGMLMNKVFKVIWSRTKNCYVVASELAKTHMKSSKSVVMSSVFVAKVLLSILSFSVFNVAEASITVQNSDVDANILPFAGNHVYLRDTTLINKIGDLLGGVNNIADYKPATQTLGSVWYYRDKTTNEIKILVNSKDFTKRVIVSGSDVVGLQNLNAVTSVFYDGELSANSPVSVGNGAKSTGNGGISLGTYANAKSTNSVALGAFSVAKALIK